MSVTDPVVPAAAAAGAASTVTAPTGVGIRAIEPGDVPAVVRLVHDLASYEKLPELCRLTDAQLEAALFGPAPALFGLVAPDGDGVGGFALYFLSFSTWEGVHGIYLEDLFVRPELRGSGLGRALLNRLAGIAVERGFARVEWSVLDWNTPSIDFYRSLGAVPMDEWTTFRLTGPALRTAAESG
jgi:GNAT superfamily N-acetyltransferase